MAEMEGGGQEAGGDQPQRQTHANKAEPSVRGQKTQGRSEAQQDQQAVSGARRGGEEDDGDGWMHG